MNIKNAKVITSESIKEVITNKDKNQSEFAKVSGYFACQDCACEAFLETDCACAQVY